MDFLMRAKEKREIADGEGFSRTLSKLEIRRLSSPPESATSLIKLVISGNDYA